MNLLAPLPLAGEVGERLSPLALAEKLGKQRSALPLARVVGERLSPLPLAGKVGKQLSLLPLAIQVGKKLSPLPLAGEVEAAPAASGEGGVARCRKVRPWTERQSASRLFLGVI